MSEAAGVINSFSELISAVCDTLLRPDLSMEAGRWIQQAELELVRDCDIRAADQTKTGSITADTSSLALPPGLIELRSMQVTDTANNPHFMKVVSPDRVIAVRDSQTNGVPEVYYIHGDTIEFAPASNATTALNYEMKYYGLPTPLSDENQSNLLLELGSDALMYGALMHGAVRIADPERFQFYQPMFASAKESLKRAYWRSRLSGPLEQRPDFALNDSHAEY